MEWSLTWSFSRKLSLFRGRAWQREVLGEIATHADIWMNSSCLHTLVTVATDSLAGGI